jgi:hypothetical protein
MEIKKVKFDLHISDDGRKLLVSDAVQDEIVCKMSFYHDEYLSKDDKEDIGKMIIQKLLTIKADRIKGILQSPDKRSAFRSAYQVEEASNNINKTTVIWLLNSILNLDPREANKRYELATEILSTPEFDGKSSAVVDKIYLSENNFYKED